MCELCSLRNFVYIAKTNEEYLYYMTHVDKKIILIDQRKNK
jgi:hypothetical protein